ncbi:MAG: HEAT repeat domain-containing protein [Candidatus Muiribacteriaceae bacterium]
MNDRMQKFLEMVQEDNIDRKLYAIKKLKEYKDRKVVNALIPLLENESPMVRYLTAQSLGDIGDVEAGESLLKALVEPEDWVRLGIVEAIGQIRPEKASEMLIRYMNDEKDNKVKATIIKVLGFLNDEKVIPFIAEYLNSQDERIKANTIEALQNFNNSKIIELLTPFKNDRNNRVRANTALLFVKKGKSEGYDILYEMLEDRNEWMQASAVYALGEIGGEKEFSTLVSKDMFRDGSWSIRRNVIIALAKMCASGMKNACEHIENILASDNEQEVVFTVEMIGEHGLKEFLPVITSMLTDATGDLREKIDEAIDTLTDIRP